MDPRICSYSVEDECLTDKFKAGDKLQSRYVVTGVLGEGATAVVLKCLDVEKRKFVAIKVFHRMYSAAAWREIAFLLHLERHDITGGTYFVKLERWFEFQNHICLVLEVLGLVLETYLAESRFQPLRINEVRKIGKQLLERVAVMHDLRLVHADLKPENIACVLRKDKFLPSATESISFTELCDSIKLIDFGSTVCGVDGRSHRVSSAWYRAPEVFLGLRWSFPCDIWAIGCILWDLCSEWPMFDAEDDLESLAMMERVLGKIPQQMLERVGGGCGDLVRGGKLNWPDGASSVEKIAEVARMCPLEKHEVCAKLGEDFIDLLRGLLRFDPSKRLTAKEALQHPFFREDGCAVQT